jgi:hypothetical protein
MTNEPGRQNLSSYIEIWCQEAMSEFGSDWIKIADHLRKKLKSLPEDVQDQLSFEAILTLAGSTGPQNSHDQRHARNLH